MPADVHLAELCRRAARAVWGMRRHRAALQQAHRVAPRSAHRRGTVIVVGLLLVGLALGTLLYLAPPIPRTAAVVGPSGIVPTSSTVAPPTSSVATGSPTTFPSFPDEDIPQRSASAPLPEENDQGKDQS